MYKKYVGIAALVVAGIAFFIASDADSKATKLKKAVDDAVDNMSDLSEYEVARKFTTSMAEDALRKAAERKAAEITRIVQSRVQAEIHDEVSKKVLNVVEEVKDTLDVEAMVKSKLRKVLSGMSLDDILEDFRDDILEELKDHATDKLDDLLDSNATIIRL